MTNGNNFLILSCSLFHLSCHLKRYSLSKHFFPWSARNLKQTEGSRERKVCDKFPFPILDSSIKIEFLCSKCSCPCFMLVELRLRSPDVERIYTARCSPFSHYRPHCTLFSPSPPKKKKVHNHCLRFLLRRLVPPRRNWKQWFCKFLFGGRNKVHYGPCETGELPARINNIDLARAKSEAPVNSNLSFKSNNKLAIVFYKSVNFRAHSCDF